MRNKYSHSIVLRILHFLETIVLANCYELIIEVLKITKFFKKIEFKYWETLLVISSVSSILCLY